MCASTRIPLKHAHISTRTHTRTQNIPNYKPSSPSRPDGRATESSNSPRSPRNLNTPSRKVFRCPSLERRLAGLMHICDLVALAEQREASTATNGSLLPPGEGRDTAWVTARAMEEWLVEVRFLEELFGSSMHVELVSTRQFAEVVLFSCAGFFPPLPSLSSGCHIILITSGVSRSCTFSFWCFCKRSALCFVPLPTPHPPTLPPIRPPCLFSPEDQALGVYPDVPRQKKRREHQPARPPLEQHPWQARGRRASVRWIGGWIESVGSSRVGSIGAFRKENDEEKKNLRTPLVVIVVVVVRLLCDAAPREPSSARLSAWAREGGK